MMDSLESVLMKREKNLFFQDKFIVHVFQDNSLNFSKSSILDGRNLADPLGRLR